MRIFNQATCLPAFSKPILRSAAIYCFSFFAFVSLVLVSPHKANALTTPSETDSSVSELPSDIRVLIDVSGSMKQNDPRNLRRPAMDLLVQLFPEQSRAGVWTFGQYVNMLVPHKPVATGWRSSAEQQSRLVNSVALRTNIGLALEKANYDADPKIFPGSLEYNRSVILLTDGVVDISKDASVNEQERQRIINELIPAYKKSGVKIHTVALSTNADVELLEKLSLETNGIFAVAEDAGDLNRIFLRAFDQSSPADRVPLEGNSFVIDSSVEEFTALVFRKPNSDATQLLSPSGEQLSANSSVADMRWFSSEEYDLITVQRPDEGMWTINAEMDPENRVTVVSDLELAFEALPANIYLGQLPELKLSLQENGETITRKAFLDLLSVEASLSREQLKFWQQTLPKLDEQPGVFRRSLDMLRNVGYYSMTVTVDGKTFKREKRFQFTVREPFRVEVSANEASGEYFTSVVAVDQAMRNADIVIEASILQPDGESVTRELEAEGNGVWSLRNAAPVSGTYELSLKALANGSTPMEYKLGEYQLLMDIPGAPQVIAVPEEGAVVEEAVAEKPVAEAPVVEEPERKEVVEEEAETAEVEVVEEPVAEQASTDESAESSTNWILYASLAIGNLALFGGLFFAYRKFVATPVAEDTAVEDEAGEEKAGEEKAVKEPASEEKQQEEDQGEEVEEAAEEEPEELKNIVAEADAEADTESDAAADDEIEIDLEAMLDIDEEEPVAASTDEESADEENTAENGTDKETADEKGADEESAVGEMSAEAEIEEEAKTAEPEKADEPDAVEPLPESDDVEVSDEDIDVLLAEAEKEEQVMDDESEPESLLNDEDDITLELDGAFDLSTDISEDATAAEGDDSGEWAEDMQKQLDGASVSENDDSDENNAKVS